MTDTHANHTDKALRGLRHIGTARLVTQLLQWGLTVITVHLLRPRDYGLVATAGILTVFAQMLLDGGLGEVLVSQKDLSCRLQGAAFSAVLFVSTVLGTLVFAAAPFASSFFHSPALRYIIEVSSLSLPLNALGVVPTAQLAKQMRFKTLAFAQTASGIAQAFSTVALAYMGAAYWALIIGVFVGTGLSLALRWAAVDHKPVPNLHLTELRPLFRNSSHMIGQRLSYFSIDNLDIFLLSRIWGPVALGSYSVARNLAHTALDKISAITGQISVSAFAARSETNDQIRGLITIISAAATIIFPLFWIMGIVSQVAFPLVFGTRWANLVIPFLAFTAILPLRTVYSLVNAALIGTGRTGLTLKNTFTWAAILIPFMLVGTLAGPDGVALSWTVAFPLVFYVATRQIARAFSIRVTIIWHPMLVPAACAGISALIGEGVLIVLSTHVTPALILACQCTFAGVSYLLLLRQLSPAQYTQTLSLLRRIFTV